MPIPTKKAPPERDLALKTILFYGPPKCGKSSFWAQAPDTIFLATEPGLDNLEVLAWNNPDGNYVIRTWQAFKQAIAEVKAAKKFKTVVIDTIDNAWLLCHDHVCKNAGVEYVNDGALGYGKGSSLIQAEMRKVLMDLCDSNFGVVLISHAKLEDVEGLVGTAKKVMPTLNVKAREVVLGLVDMILYIDLRDAGGGKIVREIRAEQSKLYEAGDRTGRLPASMPLSYAEFVKAYHAKLPATPAKNVPPAVTPQPTSATPPAVPADKAPAGGALTLADLQKLAADASAKAGHVAVRETIKAITGSNLAAAKPAQFETIAKALKEIGNAKPAA